jgi:hypothetical protein
MGPDLFPNPCYYSISSLFVYPVARIGGNPDILLYLEGLFPKLLRQPGGLPDKSID